jgi:hypothetical protein
MTSALLKIVAHEQPIQDMDRSAYSWLRFRAASALATLGTVGQNSEVHDGIIKLIANLRSLDERCATAALLAKIKYDGAKIDAASTAEGLFALTRDLAADESKRAKEFQDAEIGVGGVAQGGAASFDPLTGTPEERFPRRQVLDRLADLKAGLKAVRPAMPADAQAKLDSVVTAIDPVIAAAIDKATVELKLTQAIVAMAAAIERAVPAAAAAPATAQAEVEAAR